jgi:glycosyltransferase involved in cell wall biosynthesis
VINAFCLYFGDDSWSRHARLFFGAWRRLETVNVVSWNEPAHAEGWGLPVTEAMACGLPVIVTDYSAPAEYLSDDCTYLIPVERFVPVRDAYFFPSGGALGVWAQPDAGALRELMRRAFENPEEAREKGRRARAKVCARLTWGHAATNARRLLWLRA